MQNRSPIWPAQLDHIRLDAPEPNTVAQFYRDVIGMTPIELEDGTVLLQGPERRLVIGRGPAGGQPWSGFRLQSPAQRDALRAHLEAQGIAIEASPSPVFGEASFAVRDPDGRLAVFGLVRDDLGRGVVQPAAALPGRLQHVVVATTDLARLVGFYRDGLGFLTTDIVREGETPTAMFLRADPEHHSFACFRAPEARPDHHAYEANSWNDLRDWADHLSRHDIKIWWGPGRHGPGNNLFLMAKDPQGYLFEISAELEVLPRDMAPRLWPHAEKTLNLWGPGWMRS